MIAPGAQPPLDVRIAPNIGEHRGRVALGSRALNELRISVALAIAASIITTILGLFVLEHVLSNPTTPGPAFFGSTRPDVLIALAAGGLQITSLLVGFNAVMDFPGTGEPSALNATSQRRAAAVPYLGFALLILLSGAIIGYSIGGDEGRQNLHYGVPPAPYAPTMGVLLATAVWGGTSVAFNVLVAFGMRAHLAPLIREDASRPWMAFLALSIAGSFGSVAFSLYGVMYLGGTNPAPLMAIVSVASLAFLLHLASLALHDWKNGPEPAPLWPAFVPVVLTPGSAPTMQGYDPQARPPARCPKCDSAKLSYFMVVPPQAQCHQCGQWVLF